MHNPFVCACIIAHIYGFVDSGCVCMWLCVAEAICLQVFVVSFGALLDRQHMLQEGWETVFCSGSIALSLGNFMHGPDVYF